MSMNDLIIICQNNQLYTDSREIAKVTKIRHADLLRRIKKYETVLLNAKLRSVEYFILSGYVDESGKENKCYLVTKKGCDMVANKMTGDKGILFTALYIEQFYQMERLLQEHNSPQWQQTRLESKNTRKLEAEEIKQLVQYAKAQGSENAEKYYITLSKLANKTVGISSTERERANINQLNTLILVENIINHRIQEGIKQGLHYKEIYRSCKERLKQFKEIAYLTEIKAVEGK